MGRLGDGVRLVGPIAINASRNSLMIALNVDAPCAAASAAGDTVAAFVLPVTPCT